MTFQSHVCILAEEIKLYCHPKTTEEHMKCLITLLTIKRSNFAMFNT